MRLPRWAAGRVPLLASLALVLVAVAVLIAIRPRASEDGFLALRALLAEAGPGVSQGSAPLDGTTFFLPTDLRDEREAQDLLGWVRRGGRLVVADPSSRTAELAGLIPGPHISGLTPLIELSPRCLSPLMKGVGRMLVSPGEGTWSSRHPRALTCFGSPNGPYVVRMPLGQGLLVAVGGTSALDDVGIGEADNAAFAWNLLAAAGRPVRIGEPVPAGSERPAMGIWDVLPPAARGVVLQVGLAGALLLLALGRRLGRPIEEALPAPIPGAALVGATSELYRRAAVRDHAVSRLRGRLRSVARNRLSLSPEADDAAIASAIERAGIAARGEVEGLLSEHRVEADAALASLAEALSDLEGRIAGREEP